MLHQYVMIKAGASDKACRPSNRFYQISLQLQELYKCLCLSLNLSQTAKVAHRLPIQNISRSRDQNIYNSHVTAELYLAAATQLPANAILPHVTPIYYVRSQ